MRTERNSGVHHAEERLTIIELLLDLSGAALDQSALLRVTDNLGDRDGLGSITARASCILPAGILAPAGASPGWRFALAENALEASNRAIQAAARAQRPLVVLLGAALAGGDAIGTLLEAVASDPLFGFAVARTATEDGRLTKIQSDLGDRDIATLSRSVLAALPPQYIVPEVVGTCFVVRAEVVANMGLLSSDFQTTVGAWLHYLCRARRVGFRGVIVNRAVIPITGEIASSILAPCSNDFWRAHRQFPDTAYAREEFARLAAHEYESFLGRVRCTEEGKRNTLLLDARGMPAHHNGTAASLLGLMSGFAAAARDWNISVLVKPDANSFHKVSERYPDWEVFEELPDARFSIALGLNQPWDGRTLEELHQRALFVFYFMHDTISWDILYNCAAPQTVEAAWRFIAEYADGLVFNSDFSRRRFNTRFQPSPLVRQSVSYLSFHPGDYFQNGHASGRGEYILVVGNHLDHKWIAPTVELLATAFPFQGVYAFGSSDARLPNVTCIPSGDRSDEEIARLFEGARIIVFPSFYEGFGFPVLQGLSCGKAVVARRSTLLDEIAERSRADGNLYAFSDPGELLDVVGGLLRGDVVDRLPLSSGLAQGQAPVRWPEIASGMLDFMSASFEGSGEQWMRRARSIELYHGW